MRDNSDTSRNDSDDDDSDGVHLTLEHVFPEGLKTLASNHVTVQHSEEGEFILSFYDVIQPIILGERKEVLEQIKKLDSVKATCFSRVSVSAGRMPKLISALATTYDKYLKSQSKPESDNQGKKHAI